MTVQWRIMRPPAKPRIVRRYHLRAGGIVYLLVTMFIGAAAINSQTNLLFWIFGLMLGGLIVSVLFSGAMLAGLRVRRLLPDHGAVGEPLIVRYELANVNRIVPAFGLVISELDSHNEARMAGRPHGLVLHIGPRANVHAEATGYPRRRGAMTFNRIQISSTFPFGIFRKSITVEQPGRMVVYPELKRMRRDMLAIAMTRDLVGSRPSEQAGGTEEFYGLREYRHGDALKMIDWKHSARMGMLVSRELTRQTPPRLMVLLDLREIDSHHQAAERAISFAASIICEAHRESYEVGLAVAGVACPFFEVRHSRWHRTRLLHALGELDLSRRAEGSGWADLRDVNWLVIHAGDADLTFGPPGARHVSDAVLEDWAARTLVPAQGTGKIREAVLSWA